MTSYGYKLHEVLAMPWPHFLALYGAIAPEPEQGPGSMDVDRAKAIQRLYQEHRAQRSAVSRN